MLDSISPFKQKRHLLRQLNCLQFFKSRFGIGVSIAKLLCFFSEVTSKSTNSFIFR